jgi:hypothetical protein
VKKLGLRQAKTDEGLALIISNGSSFHSFTGLYCLYLLQDFIGTMDPSTVPDVGTVPDVDAFAVAFASVQVAPVAPDPAADNTDESVSIADVMVPVANDKADDDDMSSIAPLLQLQPLLTLNAVRDAIVSDSTNRSYNGYIFYFVLWLFDYHRECLTDNGVAIISSYYENRPDSNHRAIVRLFRDNFIHHLRLCLDHAMVILATITPSLYLDFLIAQRNQRTGLHLGRSAFRQRRASLKHFFRLHNRIGFSGDYSNELTNLYKGLFRVLNHLGAAAQRAYRRNHNRNINLNADDNAHEADGAHGVWAADDSKLPMSVRLLRSICGWLLKYRTEDGVFAHCFLLLTWNLACRVNNTACIKLCDMNWTGFDCFTVTFAHSKTDQVGDESKYP